MRTKLHVSTYCSHEKLKARICVRYYLTMTNTGNAEKDLFLLSLDNLQYIISY